MPPVKLKLFDNKTPDRVLKSTIDNVHLSKVKNVLDELGTVSDVIRKLRGYAREGHDIAEQAFREKRTTFPETLLKKHEFKRVDRHVWLDALQVLRASLDGELYTVNTTQFGCACILDDLPLRKVAPDRLRDVTGLAKKCALHAAKKKLQAVAKGLQLVTANSERDTVSAWVKLGISASEIAELRSTMEGDDSKGRVNYWADNLLRSAENLGTDAFSSEYSDLQKRMDFVDQIVGWVDEVADDYLPSRTSFANEMALSELDDDRLVVTKCGTVLTMTWARAGVGEVLLLDRDHLLNVSNCLEARMVWCLLANVSTQRRDLLVPEWITPLSSMKPCLARIIHVIDVLLLTHTPTASVLADNYEQTVASRLLLNHDRLRFRLEYADTVRSKVIDDMLDQPAEYTSWGAWDVKQLYRDASRELVGSAPPEEADYAARAQHTFANAQAVIDFNGTVDYIACLYQFSRAWIYAVVDPIASFAKFRSNVLKPVKDNEEVRRAVKESRGATVMGICIQEITKHGVFPAATYTGTNRMLAHWVENKIVDLDLTSSRAPSLIDWADVHLRMQKPFNFYANSYDMLKPKGAAVFFQDLFSVFSSEESGGNKSRRTHRRLLLDIFVFGLPDGKELMTKFMEADEDMDALLFLVQEKERNYRHNNAREYAWCNFIRRMIHTMQEANMRETMSQDSPEITSGMPHHKMIEMLMRFHNKELEGGQASLAAFRSLRMIMGMDYSKWCLNKNSVNTSGFTSVADEYFGLDPAQIKQNPQLWNVPNRDKLIHGCYARSHPAFDDVVYATADPLLCDSFLMLTDSEAVEIKKMPEKKRRQALIDKLCAYRHQLQEERELVSHMTDDQRKQWCRATHRSAVMGKGRINEGQLQTTWSGDTNSDIKVPAHKRQIPVDQLGVGDDQIVGGDYPCPREMPPGMHMESPYKEYFENALLGLRDAIIAHSVLLDKPLNDDETYMAIDIAIYNKEILVRARPTSHLFKKGGRFDTENNAAILDADQASYMATSAAFDAAGSHTCFVASFVVGMVNSVAAIVRSFFRSYIDNKPWPEDAITAVWGRSSPSLAELIEHIAVFSPNLDGWGVPTVLGMLDRKFPDAPSMECAESWLASIGMHGPSMQLYACLESRESFLLDKMSSIWPMIEDPYTVPRLPISSVNKSYIQDIMEALPAHASGMSNYGKMAKYPVKKERQRIHNYYSTIRPAVPVVVSSLAGDEPVAEVLSTLSKFASPGDMGKIAPLNPERKMKYKAMERRNMLTRLRSIKVRMAKAVSARSVADHKCPTALITADRLTISAFQHPLQNCTVPYPMVQFSCRTKLDGPPSFRLPSGLAHFDRSQYAESDLGNPVMTLMGKNSLTVGGATSLHMEGGEHKPHKSQRGQQAAMRHLCSAAWLFEEGGTEMEYAGMVAESRYEESAAVQMTQRPHRATGHPAHRMGGGRVSMEVFANTLFHVGLKFEWVLQPLSQLCRDSRSYVIHIQALKAQFLTLAASAMTSKVAHEMPESIYTVFEPRCPCCLEPSNLGKMSITGKIIRPRTIVTCPAIFTKKEEVADINDTLRPPGLIAKFGAHLLTKGTSTPGLPRGDLIIKRKRSAIAQAYAAAQNCVFQNRRSITGRAQHIRVPREPIMSFRIFSTVPSEVFLEWMVRYTFICNPVKFLTLIVQCDGNLGSVGVRAFRYFDPSPLFHYFQGGVKLADYQAIKDAVGRDYAGGSKLGSFVNTMRKHFQSLTQVVLTRANVEANAKDAILFCSDGHVFSSSECMRNLVGWTLLRLLATLQDDKTIANAARICRSVRALVEEAFIELSADEASRKYDIVDLGQFYKDKAKSALTIDTRDALVALSDMPIVRPVVSSQTPNVLVATLNPNEADHEGTFFTIEMPGLGQSKSRKAAKHNIPDRSPACNQEGFPHELILPDGIVDEEVVKFFEDTSYTSPTARQVAEAASRKAGTRLDRARDTGLAVRLTESEILTRALTSREPTGGRPADDPGETTQFSTGHGGQAIVLAPRSEVSGMDPSRIRQRPLALSDQHLRSVPAPAVSASFIRDCRGQDELVSGQPNVVPPIEPHALPYWCGTHDGSRDLEGRPRNVMTMLRTSMLATFQPSLGDNRAASWRVEVLAKDAADIANAYGKYIAIALVEGVDVKVHLDLGGGAGSVCYCVLSDTRNVSGHYISLMRSSDLPDGSRPYFCPQALEGIDVDKKLPYLRGQNMDCNDLTRMECYIVNKMYVDKMLAGCNEQHVTSAYADFLILEASTALRVLKNYQAALISASLAARRLKPGEKFWTKIPINSCQILYAALCGYMLVFSKGKIYRNTMMADSGPEFQACFWGPRSPPGVDTMRLSVRKAYDYAGADGVVWFPRTLKYEIFMSTVWAHVKADEVITGGFDRQKFKNTYKGVRAYGARVFSSRLETSVALICNTSLRDVTQAVGRSADKMDKVKAYLEEQLVTIRGEFRDLLQVAGRKILAEKPPGALDAAKYAGKKPMKIVDRETLRYTAVLVLLALIKNKPATAEAYVECCTKASNIKYRLDIDGITIYANPCAATLASSYGKPIANVWGPLSGVNWETVFTSELGYVETARNYVDRSGKRVDKDHIRQNPKLCREIGNMLLKCTSIADDATEILVNGGFFLPRSGTVVCLYDTHSGEGYIPMGVASALIRHGRKVHVLLHTANRDTTTARTVFDDAGVSVQWRKWYDPVRAPSFKGWHIVVLDIQWNLDCDLRIQSDRKQNPGATITFWTLLERTLASGAIALFTSEPGFPTNILNVYANKVSSAILHSRLVHICQRTV